MKRTPWMYRCLAVACALLLGGIGPVSRAAADEPPTSDVAIVTSDGSSDDLDRWWGVAGAALCGLEFRLVRTVPEIGMNPYVLAAGIGGCLIAVLDIATT